MTPKEEIDKLVAGLARFPDAAILSDEIYGQLTYDGLAHRSLLAYPEIRDRLILLDGWSKTYAMTGWRLGYSVWPKPWRDVARKLAVNSYSCVNSAAQFAGIAALKGPQDSVAAMRAEFDRRRKAVVAGLNRLPGVTAVTPKGAFYAFPERVEDGLEGEAARLGAARGSGRRDRRRPRFRRPRRGLSAPLLRQLAREHRTRARAHARIPEPSGLGERRRLTNSTGKADLMRPSILAAALVSPPSAPRRALSRTARRARRRPSATPRRSGRAISPNA